MDLNRRTFFQRFLTIGATGSLALGCNHQRTSETVEEINPKPAVSEGQEFSCLDTSSLTETEASLRQTFKYTDQSPEEGKNCETCALYVPSDDPTSCGGCNTIKGPIHPLGHCTIWAALTG